MLDVGRPARMTFVNILVRQNVGRLKYHFRANVPHNVDNPAFFLLLTLYNSIHSGICSQFQQFMLAYNISRLVSLTLNHNINRFLFALLFQSDNSTNW